MSNIISKKIPKELAGFLSMYEAKCRKDGVTPESLESLFFDNYIILAKKLDFYCRPKVKEKIIKQLYSYFEPPRLIKQFIKKVNNYGKKRYEKELVNLNVILLKRKWVHNGYFIIKTMRNCGLSKEEIYELIDKINDYYHLPRGDPARIIREKTSEKLFGLQGVKPAPKPRPQRSDSNNRRSAELLMQIITGQATESSEIEAREETSQESVTEPLETMLEEPFEFSQESLNRFERFLQDPLLLTWQEFEDMSEDYFRALGAVIIPVPVNEAGDKIRSNDGGIDVRFYFNIPMGRVDFAVQCKRYDSNIGAERVDAFYGAMGREAYNNGIFLTTSDYTQGVMERFEQYTANNPTKKVTIITGAEMQEMVKQVLEKDFTYLQSVFKTTNEEKDIKDPVFEAMYRRIMLGTNRILNPEVIYTDTTLEWFLTYPRMLILHSTNKPETARSYRREILQIREQYEKTKELNTISSVKDNVEEVITDLNTLLRL